MIPTENEAKELWDTYHLPEAKRVHVALVTRVALFLADKLVKRGVDVHVDLLRAAALLHDIDKAVPKLPGERHPDAAVRIVRAEGMEEVAHIIKTHSLHLILTKDTAPTSWEEKVLYLADKMVKYDIVGVDGRFDLWNNEHLPQAAQRELDECYPKVKQLEKEVFDIIGMKPEDLPSVSISGNT